MRWTDVNTPANGDLNFFRAKEKGQIDSHHTVAGSIAQARDLLSVDVQIQLMYRLLHQMKEKKAISLDYLTRSIEHEEIEEPGSYGEG